MSVTSTTQWKAKERSTFEGKLDSNTSLKKKVEEVKSIIQGVETATLQERMDSFHEALSAESQRNPQASRVRHFDFRKFAVAASVAILIGIAGFWLLTRQEPNDLLFDKHFSPDPGLPTTMSSSSNYEFYDAMVSYKRGDYDAAITQWELLLNQKPENDTLNYFIGVAYLANSNTNKALQHLKTASETKNGVFAKETLYYLGMANLKAANIEAARNYLNQSQTEKSRVVISELDD